MRERSLPARLLALVPLLVFLAACSASPELAVITQRPVPVPSTETPAAPAVAKSDLTPFPAGYEHVQAGRFDGGKMWTFENPPLDYFAEAYDFRPDSSWFDHARTAALRFATYCSASFVSPQGLVMTNHHCGRQSITKVSKSGENLLDAGFYAETLDAERKVDELFVDQLIAIEDITDRIYEATVGQPTDDTRAEARARQAEMVGRAMTNLAREQDTTHYVQIVPLYNGGAYSAYTFKRYHDVRLVMAPELKIGFFGGDPDNFTYPRYNFDMTFFRVYDDEGMPLKTPTYFAWSDQGAKEGDAVFVVGNPGSTSRLSTVSQLEYQRDVALPQLLEVLRSRHAILEAFLAAHPDEAEEEYKELRNASFSISNSIKSINGQLEGLQDPSLIARRAAAERSLQQQLVAVDSLEAAYMSVFEEIRSLQGSKRATARRAAPFTYFLNPNMSSHVMMRAVYGYFYALMKQRGAMASQLKEIKDEALEIEDWPAEVEKAFLAARLHALKTHLGDDDPTVRRILGGLTPEAVADSVVMHTALLDSARYAAVLESGYFGSGDPTVAIVQAIAPLYFNVDGQVTGFSEREQALNARLARGLFAVEGTRVPPDASFSLRLADGRVAGYRYNGTKAPAFTTLYGLYNHHHSYPDRDDWHLPERWLEAQNRLNLSTAVNLVSTNDITGGNSGSPLLNRDLEIVGLAFDGNIESLPNEFVYRDEAARTISVDSRGILEVLRGVYAADRLVEELTAGQRANGASGTGSE